MHSVSIYFSSDSVSSDKGDVCRFLDRQKNETPFKCHWNTIMGLDKESIAHYKEQHMNC